MPNKPIQLDAPVEHPCYPDHFPGDPLVPAALLLQWIEVRLATVLPGMRIGEIRSAKFLRAVRPGTRCALHWEHKPDKRAVHVECRGGGGETVCRVHFILKPSNNESTRL